MGTDGAQEQRNNGKSITTSKRRQKQLIFDSRYGWIYDEWRYPAEVALVGGRGMFCILPLTKAAAKLAFQWVNIAADLLIRRLESSSYPHSPQAWFKFAKEMVRCNFKNWCHGLISFGKPLLFDSSRLKSFNLSGMRKKAFVQSLLQYKETRKETDRNN